MPPFAPPERNPAILCFTVLSSRGVGGVRATVAATMPVSAGLGSSAAYSVSLAAALLTLVGEVSSQQRGGEGEGGEEGGKEGGDEGGEEGGKEGGEEGRKGGASKSETEVGGERREEPRNASNEDSGKDDRATKTPENGESTPHTATPPYPPCVSLPEAVLSALRDAEEDGTLRFAENGSLRGAENGSACGTGGGFLTAALSPSSFVGWSQQELERINHWGLEAERLNHGTPSGIDNAVSTFGECVYVCVCVCVCVRMCVYVCTYMCVCDTVLWCVFVQLSHVISYDFILIIILMRHHSLHYTISLQAGPLHFAQAT